MYEGLMQLRQWVSRYKKLEESLGTTFEEFEPIYEVIDRMTK